MDNVLIANAGGNVLRGLAGNDTLRGGAGVDWLYGGAGNDYYVVDSAGDVVVELAGDGLDLVKALVSFTLAANVEDMNLGTSDAIDGTGNDLANAIDGNAGANVLRGLGGDDTLQSYAGRDTLEGGRGNDRLVGGVEADTYLFGRGDGQDTVVDYDPTPGAQDVLHFGSGISADQLWLRKVGGALEISIIGTSDKVSINNWSGPNNAVEVIELDNGQHLLGDQMQNLIAAMANLATPPAGQTTLSAAYQTALADVIAASWSAPEDMVTLVGVP